MASTVHHQPQSGEITSIVFDLGYLTKCSKIKQACRLRSTVRQIQEENLVQKYSHTTEIS